MDNLKPELELACQVARQAGALILGYFGRKIAVAYKPGEGPVTQADREANALIVEKLRAAFPQDGLLSEESPDDGSRLRQSRVWMIDPLDGTIDFIHGRPDFSTMIGLLIDGRPALGVVFQPITGKLYRAVQGGGAEEMDANGRITSMHVSQVEDLTELRLAVSRAHRHPAIDRVCEVCGIVDELGVGSVGLKLCLIARGDRDLYVNPATHASLWDTCGPEAILHEAGGLLTDLDGALLDYLGPSLHHLRGLVASNRLGHPRVMEKLRQLQL